MFSVEDIEPECQSKSESEISDDLPIISGTTKYAHTNIAFHIVPYFQLFSLETIQQGLPLYIAAGVSFTFNTYRMSLGINSKSILSSI